MEIRFQDYLLTFFFLFTIWAIDNCRKYFRLKSQIEKIKWCRSDLTFDNINNLGFEVVNTAYCFRYEQDAPYVQEILKNFKLSIQSQFFNSTLSTEKKINALSNKDYVMLYLHSYLCNMNMHIKIADEELIKHSYDIHTHKTTYLLSNSGFAFYRLLYIVTSYCKQTENIRNTGHITTNLDKIEEVLDSGIDLYFM